MTSIQVERAASATPRAVVIGHGGVSLLGWRPAGVCVLAILLFRAGADWRVGQLARRYAIDYAEAQRGIERSDAARKRYLRHYFDCDTYDRRGYDLVLNTGAPGIGRVAIALARRAVQATADDRAVPSSGL